MSLKAKLEAGQAVGAFLGLRFARCRGIDVTGRVRLPAGGCRAFKHRPGQRIGNAPGHRRWGPMRSF